MGEMDLEDVKERIPEGFSRELVERHWAILTVVGVFLLALYIRYLPEQGMRYLQALDPYMIFRKSQHLAYSGSLPSSDFMMYFPYNAPNYLHNLGDIVFPAILWWTGGRFFFPSYLEWGQFYPALMGALSTVVMYFFGKEAFDEKVGVFSAFFLAVTPGVLRRSSAGFFEKEPIGTFFMMCTLYFFTRAWRREERFSGILSGLSLAFFTISWGGSRMMWLLLPLVVGSVIFIDEEIHELLVAYTPTVLIGGGAAYALNYNKFSITGALFAANLGLLGLLWSRHLVERLDLIEQERLKYYIPSMSLLGVLALVLSPLFSPYLTRIFMKIIDMVTQSASGTIGITVAENQAPGVGQVISSLGASASATIHPGLGVAGSFLGTWPMMILGTGFLGTTVFLKLLKKYGFVEDEISKHLYYAGFLTVFTAWTLAVSGYFMNLYRFAVAGSAAVLVSYLVFTRYLDGETTFKLSGMIAVSGAVLEGVLFAGNANLGMAMIPPLVLGLAGVFYLFYNDQLEGVKELDANWFAVIPLFWVASNLLGALARSRLIFLSAFPAAFVAGYGLKVVFEGLQNADLSMLEEYGNIRNFRYAGLASLLVLVVASTGAAGYVNAQSVGGSPNSAWYTSLDYMEERTQPGSVIMSWWDYGYHFESIGRRPSIANGWNAGYYTGETRAVNMPLADFLTADDPLNTEGISNFLGKHSVDYVVLDHTMIGKYSAVSTISNKATQLPNETSGEIQSMNSLSTPRNVRQAISRSGDTTTVTYRSGSVTIGVPINISNSSVEFSGVPTFQQQTSRGPARASINCVITEEGEVNYDVESRVPYCVAEDPYYNLERGLATRLPARLILVPKSIKDSTLVELYLGDGSEIPWAEKLPEASNDYLKMWKVTEEG